MFESDLSIFIALVCAVIFIVLFAFVGVQCAQSHFQEKTNHLQMEINLLRMEIEESYKYLNGKTVHLVEYNEEDPDKPLEEVYAMIAKIF